MVTNWARKWGATVIQPIALFLARLGLTPNTVTVLGFLMTAAVAVVLATGRTQLAGVLLIGTLAFDAVDGTLARLMGTTSRFGAFLDSTLDRWAEVVLYGGLGLVVPRKRSRQRRVARRRRPGDLFNGQLHAGARRRCRLSMQRRSPDPLRADGDPDRRADLQPSHLGTCDHRHPRGFHRRATHLGDMAGGTHRGIGGI